MRMCLYTILVALLMLAACQEKYSAYLADSDNRQLIDSVFITDKPDLAASILYNKKEVLRNSCIWLYTDSIGYFSFKDDKDSHREFYLVKQGYELLSISQSGFDGDTILMKPTSVMLEKRYPPQEYITQTHQLPLQIGKVKFIIHEAKVNYQIRDTVNPISQSYDAIYIDTDRQSKHYERAIDFKLDEQYYPPIKTTKKQQLPDSFPRRWVELTRYDGEFYIYLPLGRYISRYEITDTSLISFGSIDGNYGFSYDSIERKGNQYIIKNINSERFSNHYQINIHTLDNKRGIAIFEYQYSEEGRSQEYKFYVDASKTRNFPLLIQEYSGTEVLMPTYFPLNTDTIDFKALLK